MKMAGKMAVSKKASEEELRELLSKEDDKLKKILIFMKSTIQETNLPWISWKMLEDNAGKILGNSRRPGADLWAIMQQLTYSLVEKEFEVIDPEFYEYKIGNTWVYFPAKMIKGYCEKEE
ncbi:MAG: hypothetical protein C3F06_14315 [Candidatus Methanoperedenaceae archaeon]|nr:MAG: hypothetical protein C3F06_14315 [Candidatus Methanoperedenaceae archaeon]